MFGVEDDDDDDGGGGSDEISGLQGFLDANSVDEMTKSLDHMLCPVRSVFASDMCGVVVVLLQDTLRCLCTPLEFKKTRDTGLEHPQRTIRGQPGLL